MTAKHANVALFIPFNGCPHRCSFCDQRSITGKQYQPTADDVKRTLTTALDSLKENSIHSEIAFFGGSFTAIDREYMLSLLKATAPYIDRFRGIRISTRPDCIDEEILSLLKTFRVSSIELGAQSMSDMVLTANDRGHSAANVRTASRLIRDFGFELGLQMMTGLYKSTPESDTETARQFIALRPDTAGLERQEAIDVWSSTATAAEADIVWSWKDHKVLPEDVCMELLHVLMDNPARRGAWLVSALGVLEERHAEL